MRLLTRGSAIATLIGLAIVAAASACSSASNRDASSNQSPSLLYTPVPTDSSTPTPTATKTADPKRSGVKIVLEDGSIIWISATPTGKSTSAWSDSAIPGNTRAQAFRVRVYGESGSPYFQPDFSVEPSREGSDYFNSYENPTRSKNMCGRLPMMDSAVSALDPQGINEQGYHVLAGRVVVGCILVDWSPKDSPTALTYTQKLPDTGAETEYVLWRGTLR